MPFIFWHPTPSQRQDILHGGEAQRVQHGNSKRKTHANGPKTCKFRKRLYVFDTHDTAKERKEPLTLPAVEMMMIFYFIGQCTVAVPGALLATLKLKRSDISGVAHIWFTPVIIAVPKSNDEPSFCSSVCEVTCCEAKPIVSVFSIPADLGRRTSQICQVCFLSKCLLITVADRKLVLRVVKQT